MNREQIEALRSQAERLCGEAYQQVVNATTEWHKSQGEFRAYDALLLNWVEDPEPVIPDIEISENEGTDKYLKKAKKKEAIDV